MLQVVSGSAADNTPSTPSGWILAGSASGGGGTFGASAGPRRLTWFVRVLAGSDTAPTTAIPSGTTGSLITGRIITLTRTAGTDWRWAATFGDDQTSGTSFSATGTTSLTWQSGDWALIGYGVASSADSYSAEAVSVTGVTFGTVTERADSAVTTGYGATAALATAAATAGTATLGPTITATLGAASTGIAGVLRVREASAACAVSPQSVFPPRNLVSATGLAGDDITTVTLYRQDGTGLTPVRAASGIDVTTQSSLLRVDAEQPLGVSINYAAALTDLYGQQWMVYSASVTSTVASDVISDAIRGVGAAIHIEEWADKKRTRDASVFNINGRYVVVGKTRSAAQASITVSTDTSDDGDALQDVLANATEGTILIRAQTTINGVDGHLAILDDDEKRNWQIEYREWDLDTAEADPWPDTLEAAGYTLQDIANNFSTLQDIAAFFPGTLLDIAMYDFGD
ncbi:hypothetical protein GTY41_03815 [Streptomyces sp. SID685]|uniref:hypothetical protein n=1 Tax=Streptomyces sp. SID685 TaxID=2690322 RepID=UPI0013692A8C|nr:hypothetical protein [Streptomyces sp. SID685]MYR84092.1 hypothetical protein [Streptomyces sp. SID685]